MPQTLSRAIRNKNILNWWNNGLSAEQRLTIIQIYRTAFSYNNSTPCPLAEINWEMTDRTSLNWLATRFPNSIEMYRAEIENT